MVIPLSRFVLKPISGFTLIELLITISIIVLLLSLIMVGFGSIQEMAKKTKTQSIAAMVANAVTAAGASQALNLSTVEHPIAGSAEPRSRFVRSEDGVDVSASGPAIKAQDLSWVDAGDRDRVILRDDLFADTIAPQFYGLERWRIGLVGTTSRWVTSYSLVSSAGAEGILTEPAMGYWIDEGFLWQELDETNMNTKAWEEIAGRAFSVAMGPVLDELVNLGAVVSPDVDRDPLIFSDRLREDLSEQSVGRSSAWQPGTVQDDDGVFKAYRPRGPVIVDAWGRELLIGATDSGALRVESAGPDGLFKWNPGPDGIFQTEAHQETPAGDDFNGGLDNISVGITE